MPEDIAAQGEIVKDQLLVDVLVCNELFIVHRRRLVALAQLAVIRGIAMQRMQPVTDVFDTLQYMTKTDKPFHIFRIAVLVPVAYKARPQLTDTGGKMRR